MIKNLSSAKEEILGKEYVDAKDNVKSLTSYIEVLRAEILNRVDKKGKRAGTEVGEDGKVGQHFVLSAGRFEFKKEGRCSISVNQEKAVGFFVKKGWEREMNVQTTIDIKKGVNPDSIPKELLKEINKYFTMTVNREVEKEVLDKKLATEEITDKEYASCVNKNWNYALKIKE